MDQVIWLQDEIETEVAKYNYLTQKSSSSLTNSK